MLNKATTNYRDDPELPLIISIHIWPHSCSGAIAMVVLGSSCSTKNSQPMLLLWLVLLLPPLLDTENNKKPQQATGIPTSVNLLLLLYVYIIVARSIQVVVLLLLSIQFSVLKSHRRCGGVLFRGTPTIVRSQHVVCPAPVFLPDAPKKDHSQYREPINQWYLRNRNAGYSKNVVFSAKNMLPYAPLYGRSYGSLPLPIPQNWTTYETNLSCYWAPHYGSIPPRWYFGDNVIVSEFCATLDTTP